jgi:hypothetical protein
MGRAKTSGIRPSDPLQGVAPKGSVLPKGQIGLDIVCLGLALDLLGFAFGQRFHNRQQVGRYLVFA